jgi:putative phage-type endonuclease
VTEPFTVLCEDTTKLTRDDWLALRQPYIGSSEAAPTLNLSPWQSGYSLYCIKKGLIPDQPMSGRFEWALAQEPVILDWWRAHEAWGLVSPGEVGRRHLMVVSNEHPWLACNPDDLFPRVTVECKIADGFDKKRWFDPATEEPAVPDHYAIQVTTQMIVTGRRQGVIVVSFGGNEPVEFIIDYDEALAAAIIEGTRKFMDLVEAGTPPDVDGSEATMNALRAQYLEVSEGEMVELSPPVAALLPERASYARVAKEAKAIIDNAKAAVMAELGEAEVAAVDGMKVATWSNTKKGRRFTWANETED